jgi:hypothetical protein
MWQQHTRKNSALAVVKEKMILLDNDSSLEVWNKVSFLSVWSWSCFGVGLRRVFFLCCSRGLFLHFFDSVSLLPSLSTMIIILSRHHRQSHTLEHHIRNIIHFMLLTTEKHIFSSQTKRRTVQFRLLLQRRKSCESLNNTGRKESKRKARRMIQRNCWGLTRGSYIIFLAILLVSFFCLSGLCCAKCFLLLSFCSVVSVGFLECHPRLVQFFWEMLNTIPLSRLRLFNFPTSFLFGRIWHLSFWNRYCRDCWCVW